MSEKVLGYTRGNAKLMLRLFREEQTKHGNRGCFCNECEQDMRNALKEYDKLVPVRLASESVDLKKLKEWCKEEMDGMDRTDDFERGVHDILEELLSWVEKGAKK